MSERKGPLDHVDKSIFGRCTASSLPPEIIGSEEYFSRLGVIETCLPSQKHQRRVIKVILKRMTELLTEIAWHRLGEDLS